MSIRKYFSEFGLNMFSEALFMMQQDQLKTFDGVENPVHIYFICTRPRISLDVNTLKFLEGTSEGEFLIQREWGFDRVPFKVPSYLSKVARFECPYPHTTLKLFNENNEIISSASVALLMSMFDMRHEALDLEVKYIGQSYGVEGARTAPNRLLSHSTLQEIYFDIISKTPDKEVWFILVQFKQILITSFDGTQEKYGTTNEEDDEHMYTVINTPITKQQEINFTEAALIRYFQPEYNDKFKYNFPNPAHSTYAECYDLDLNSIYFEVHTEDLYSRLFTKTVGPEWIHFGKFTMHSSEERRDMMNWGTQNDVK